jgi:hypothetical protein
MDTSGNELQPSEANMSNLAGNNHSGETPEHLRVETESITKAKEFSENQPNIMDGDCVLTDNSEIPAID